MKKSKIRNSAGSIHYTRKSWSIDPRWLYESKNWKQYVLHGYTSLFTHNPSAIKKSSEHSISVPGKCLQPQGGKSILKSHDSHSKPVASFAGFKVKIELSEGASNQISDSCKIISTNTKPTCQLSSWLNFWKFSATFLWKSVCSYRSFPKSPLLAASSGLRVRYRTRSGRGSPESGVLHQSIVKPFNQNVTNGASTWRWYWQYLAPP